MMGAMLIFYIQRAEVDQSAIAQPTSEEERRSLMLIKAKISKRIELVILPGIKHIKGREAEETTIQEFNLRLIQ